MREYVLALLLAAAATYLLTPLVRRGAIATRTMHAARTRDVHVVPTPLLGGVAMYGGLAAGLLVANQLTYLREAFPSPRTVPGLLLAGGLLVITGIIDDRWGMGAISKLAAQVAAGAILVWSQVVLSWVPEPSGGVFILPPQLGLTLTILLVVVTINAVNFIDGLDGLAAGIVAIAACSFLVYSYTLARVVGIHSQSVPALVAALLAGMCIGFLPYNFYPATIFMGDTGAMLLGLLLAYVPLSSTAMLDPSVLIHYSHTTVNRYPTILPVLLPAAILVIPYADLLMAVVRRTRAGMSPFAADKKHLHHRLLSVGHSHRQSVLIMYLWAALFTAAVVSLSLVRTDLIVLVALTVAAVLVLLLVTMPRLRPGRLRSGGRRTRGTSRGAVPAGPGAHASGAAGTGPRPGMAGPGAPGNAVPGSAARPGGSPGSALPGDRPAAAGAPAGPFPRAPSGPEVRFRGAGVPRPSGPRRAGSRAVLFRRVPLRRIRSCRRRGLPGRPAGRSCSGRCRPPVPSPGPCPRGPAPSGRPRALGACSAQPGRALPAPIAPVPAQRPGWPALPCPSVPAGPARQRTGRARRAGGAAPRQGRGGAGPAPGRAGPPDAPRAVGAGARGWRTPGLLPSGRERSQSEGLKKS